MTRRLTDLLRTETVGGALLLAAAVIAMVWANSPWADSYDSVRHTQLGMLDLQHWSADGLLALFFFVAALELKREVLVGELSNPRRAVVPVAAAVGGVVLPALLYLVLNSRSGHPEGWAIPTATDIAFALAVLAVAGRRLPTAFRVFLLTLAVVDDLIAILIIALAYTSGLQPLWLLASAAPLALFAAAARTRPLLPLLPLLAAGTWLLVYESGVHATVAGVALAFTVPEGALSDRLEHLLQPVSAGIAVPLFALLSIGIPADGLTNALTEPVALGIILGLVGGKLLGVLGATWLAVRATRAELDPDLTWPDITALAAVSGVGLTVSLLLAELALDQEQAQHATAGVLVGSLLATALATALLGRARTRITQATKAELGA